MSDNNVFSNLAASGNEAGQWSFAFRAAMAKIRTCMPVQVMAVHGGGLGPVGRVDVQPLVQQTDSAGNVVSLPVLYGLPYLRWQGGQSAVILDPAVGDVGLMCSADRDVSAVVATAKLSPPGSNRRFSLADGFYVGATLNGAPTQYLQFDPADGVTLNSPMAIKAQIGTDADAARLVMNALGLVLSFGGHSITINSSGIAISGAVIGDSSATFQGEGTFNGGHTVSQHEHPVSGVQTGSSTVTSQKPTG
ncbi:Gp138 family membrane-puncturing spike protein [Dyella sp. RRB7]|uniref:Gp138 family membrane-puncturing spike protein n=1 Tax=Dyella sp. RRB7 TaxID=2919502 RepID=UPI001FAA2164|nr:Gp138 family membrane-puncturing spike protein [Dyella sp. RRB7]